MPCPQHGVGGIVIRAGAVPERIGQFPVVGDRNGDRPVAHHHAVLDLPAAILTDQLVDEAASELVAHLRAVGSGVPRHRYEIGFRPRFIAVDREPLAISVCVKRLVGQGRRLEAAGTPPPSLEILR